MAENGQRLTKRQWFYAALLPLAVLALGVWLFGTTNANSRALVSQEAQMEYLKDKYNGSHLRIEKRMDRLENKQEQGFDRLERKIDRILDRGIGLRRGGRHENLGETVR